MTLERIEQIEAEAAAAIEAAPGTAELEQLRVRHLGRKAELTAILRGIAELPEAERGEVGGGANRVRKSLEALLEERAAALDAAELEQRLSNDLVDVTLPGAPPRPAGHLHLVARTTRQIEDTMAGLGYRVVEGPEIEHDYYNFTALNHPPGHPARMLQDTFYVVPPGSSAPDRPRESDREAGDLPRSEPGGWSWTPDLLLRTHTSPVQVRTMETQSPPIFVIVPGKVYRRDSDATHSPMFHQMEGLAIGEGITLADLKGTLLALLRAIFGERREIRMRPHFFPFTEPSVEVDVSCFQCEGSGELAGGERCNLCKGQGWIEILGAGMVDPNVLGFVEAHGYDPERVQGFAFGIGVERVAMLRHGVPDLRRFFDNDVRMLEQFA
jgi:phenylalanyl-tRNA synthetase alpha chain